MSLLLFFAASQTYVSQGPWSERFLFQEFFCTFDVLESLVFGGMSKRTCPRCHAGARGTERKNVSFCTERKSSMQNATFFIKETFLFHLI